MVSIADSLLFFLSGFAALLYEVVWLRQFAIIFGTSEFALAVVLSAYLAGLSLGASVAGRFVHRVQRPVLTYAILELVIAGTAVAVPIALQFARVVLVELFGGQAEPTDAGVSFRSCLSSPVPSSSSWSPQAPWEQRSRS